MIAALNIRWKLRTTEFAKKGITDVRTIINCQVVLGAEGRRNHIKVTKPVEWTLLIVMFSIWVFITLYMFIIQEHYTFIIHENMHSFTSYKNKNKTRYKKNKTNRARTSMLYLIENTRSNKLFYRFDGYKQKFTFKIIIVTGTSPYIPSSLLSWRLGELPFCAHSEVLHGPKTCFGHRTISRSDMYYFLEDIFKKLLLSRPSHCTDGSWIQMWKWSFHQPGLLSGQAHFGHTYTGEK